MPFYGSLTKHVSKETTVWKSNTNSAHIKCVALELVSDITNRTRVEFMLWYFLGLGLVWTEKNALTKREIWFRASASKEHVCGGYTGETGSAGKILWYQKSYLLSSNRAGSSFADWLELCDSSPSLMAVFRAGLRTNAKFFFSAQNGWKRDYTRNDNCTYSLKACFQSSSILIVFQFF